MRAAELQLDRLDFPEAENLDDESNAQSTQAASLKREVAGRLAAHRSRRSRMNGVDPVPIAAPRPVKARADRIAAAVAERYAQTPSYRELLAAEAARAVEAANAAAEIAARNAQAVTLAQQQLLTELQDWDKPTQPFAEEPATSTSRPDGGRLSAPTALESCIAGQSGPNSIEGSEHNSARDIASTTAPHQLAGATVRLYRDAGLPQRTATANIRAERSEPRDTALDEEENFLLDDEIVFRQKPVFVEPSGPTIPIPANLIEFPRQLVAPRKARPRLAEGPLRETADAAPAPAQLRIFEVEAEQISTSPSSGVETTVPEWSSIRLDAAPNAQETEEQAELQALLPLQTASLNLRLMAAAVDGCILGAAAVAVVAAFALRVAELPSTPVAAMGAAASLLVLFILYQLLFFTFSEATPGMRYARIGLCTFSDENPSRAQMRRRTWAILLSACPLGIGFLWALLDDDRLSWHDRISRMYQRSY